MEGRKDLYRRANVDRVHATAFLSAKKRANLLSRSAPFFDVRLAVVEAVLIVIAATAVVTALGAALVLTAVAT